MCRRLQNVKCILRYFALTVFQTNTVFFSSLYITHCFCQTIRTASILCCLFCLVWQQAFTKTSRVHCQLSIYSCIFFTFSSSVEHQGARFESVYFNIVSLRNSGIESSLSASVLHMHWLKILVLFIKLHRCPLVLLNNSIITSKTDLGLDFCSCTARKIFQMRSIV